jgi:rare lipoprotein A
MAWDNQYQSMQTRRGVVLTLAGLLGCHRKRASRVIPPPPRQPSPSAPVALGYTEEGIASWYGHPYHGRPAADGEIYDMEKLTAAHRSFPFNTWVRVFDLDSNKSVDLRIIDRGPFIEGRIIDVSHAAAREIDMIGPGTARVRVEVIRVPEAAGGVGFAVQVGAFRDQGKAERFREQMETRYGWARLFRREGSSELWRVLVGSEPTEDQANKLAERIRQDSSENRAAFVVRLDSI